MYCKITTVEDWETSAGLLKEGVTYAIPQYVYKNEVFGKVGHTNTGRCLPHDARTPSKPPLPAILDDQSPDGSPQEVYVGQPETLHEDEV